MVLFEVCSVIFSLLQIFLSVQMLDVETLWLTSLNSISVKLTHTFMRSCWQITGYCCLSLTTRAGWAVRLMLCHLLVSDRRVHISTSFRYFARGDIFLSKHRESLQEAQSCPLLLDANVWIQTSSLKLWAAPVLGFRVQGPVIQRLRQREKGSDDTWLIINSYIIKRYMKQHGFIHVILHDLSRMYKNEQNLMHDINAWTVNARTIICIIIYIIMIDVHVVISLQLKGQG